MLLYSTFVNFLPISHPISVFISLFIFLPLSPWWDGKKGDEDGGARIEGLCQRRTNGACGGKKVDQGGIERGKGSREHESVSSYIAGVHHRFGNVEHRRNDSMGLLVRGFRHGILPPRADLGLYKACGVFQDEELTSLEKVGKIFLLVKEEGQEEEAPDDTTDDDDDDDCFDL